MPRRCSIGPTASKGENEIRTAKLCYIALLTAGLLTLAACGGDRPQALLIDVPGGETPPPAIAAVTEPPAVPVAAAGTEAPAPTATPEPAAPSETPAPTAEQISYPLPVKLGDEVSVDLDDDGVKETVHLSRREDGAGSQRKLSLSIDGKDCTDALYSDGFDCVEPDPYWYAVTDIDGGDGLLEIAIQDWGPSDDYFLSFVRWKGGKLTHLGGVEGLLWDADGLRSVGSFSHGTPEFMGGGRIRSSMRLEVLQTWFADVYYGPGPDGKLAVEPQDWYYATFSTKITLLQDVLARGAADGAREEITTLPAGTELLLTATDNLEWVLCSTADGGTDYRLHLDLNNPFRVETPGGYLSVWVVMDGLSFAD